MKVKEWLSVTEMTTSYSVSIWNEEWFTQLTIADAIELFGNEEIMNIELDLNYDNDIKIRIFLT